MQSGIRKFVGGIVGGAIGSAVATGLYGVIASNAAGIDANFVLVGLVAGVGYGIVAGLIFTALPGPFIIRATILSVIAIVGEFAAGSAGEEMLATVVSFFAYGIVLTFVLRQVLTLPLPIWQPLRRSDDFKDIKAEAH